MLAVCVTWKINKVAKQANSTHNKDREMEIGLLDVGVDVEHNVIDFVKISEMAAIQATFFFGLGDLVVYSLSANRGTCQMQPLEMQRQ